MTKLSWPDEGLTRIPFFVYEDPQIYALEQERIFRGPFWNYIGLAAEVPRPGDFIRSYVGETPVIAVRDRDGEVRVLVNRCTHRGVQLCQSWSGTAQAFTCPYHQWTFDLEGRLRGIPFRRGVRGVGGMPADFDPSCHDLPRLTVTVRNGAIFASFAATTPSFEDYMGEVNLAYFDRVFDGRPLRVLGKQRQRVSANWKHVLENIKDPYHATLLHVFFVTFRLWRADQEYAIQLDHTGGTAVQYSKRRKDTAEGADIAGETTSLRKDFSLAEPRLVDMVPEYPDEKTGTMQTIWPNLIIQQTLNSLATRHAVPCGPGAFDLHWTFFGYQDDSPEMVERRLRNANLYGPAGLVSVDDSEVLRLVQRGVTTPPAGAACVELGGAAASDTEGMVNENMIRGFYRYYRQIMGL